MSSLVLIRGKSSRYWNDWLIYATGASFPVSSFSTRFQYSTTLHPISGKRCHTKRTPPDDQKNNVHLTNAITIRTIIMDSVLIVGAGIVGLTLGQALKQKNIPFEIYERDATPDARGQGWAITLHWALEYMWKMLPQETLERIQAVQVDPDVARNDNGNFLFINLETGEPKYKIPPSTRWRVNREKTRRALLQGIEEHVHWGRRVIGLNLPSDSNQVQLVFADQTTVTGRIAVGVEGSRSMVRQILRPDSFNNTPLGINFTGVAVDLTPEQIEPLRAMDPLLFQGCHPPTGAFFWFSMLETPKVNGTVGTAAERYRAQICMSWPVQGPEDEVAVTSEARLANMKRRAQGFVPFLQETVERIPEGTPVTEIKLADWECLSWDNHAGRVTLAGDAAHAMTMCKFSRCDK